MLSDINLLPRLPIKSVRQNGKQYYVDNKSDACGGRSHRALPSVTKILNATKPQEARDRLMNWRQRLGTEEANRVSTNASRRGTQTHKYIKRYLLGKDIICPDPSRPYWESIKPVLQNIDAVRLVESPVCHYDLNYAGVVDCVASFNDVPCLCEWKTADKPKGSIERLFDYPLQLAAYLGAVNYSYQDYGVDLEHVLLVVAIPKMAAEVFWLDSIAINSYWQQWEKRVAAYWQYRR